jgi:signal transduction histidine kinase
VSGSGIGLAVVDQLVRLHNGHMEIASEPGRGTQVTVMLPRAEDPTP